MSNITIKIDGVIVTLTVDGRVSVKSFSTENEARACYLAFKAKIEAATLAVKS